MIVNITIYPTDATEIIYIGVVLISVYCIYSHLLVGFIYMAKLIIFDSDVDVKTIISSKWFCWMEFNENILKRRVCFLE